MLSRRSVLLLAPGALLAYTNMSQAWGQAPTAPLRFEGQHLRRISRTEQASLSAAVRDFCGQSQGHVIPAAGPLLFDQFDAVGFMMDEYILPDGRVMLNRSDGRAGIDTVVVIDAPGSMNIVAAALLTHLCPRQGVDERFVTSNGVRFTEHFPCQWDYSLLILYPRGSRVDPALNQDLTRWAKERADAMVPLVHLDRQLFLKRFARVLSE